MRCPRLRPGYVRVLAQILALVGLALVVVRFWFTEPVSSFGGLLLWEGLAFVLVGWAQLRSRTELGSQSVVVRRWPGKPAAVPWPDKPTVFRWDEIDEVQVRRYVLFDRVAVHSTEEGWVLLPVPVRLRFMRDPAFDHAVEEVSSRASTPVPLPMPALRKLRLRNLTSLLVLLVIPPMTWFVNAAPWTQPWWPGLHEAASVPHACQVLDQPVHALLGSTATAKPNSLDGFDGRCTWDAGHVTHLDVTYFLSRRHITASGIDRAHSLMQEASTLLRGGRRVRRAHPAAGLGVQPGSPRRRRWSASGAGPGTRAPRRGPPGRGAVPAAAERVPLPGLGGEDLLGPDVVPPGVEKRATRRLTARRASRYRRTSRFRYPSDSRKRSPTWWWSGW
jgi:hypothetical protein